MIVRAARRMVRAISLGVFWRAAPSTRAIIWSRNVSPGLAVIRTTSQSESTRVPPVTALRSPPLSRMTGALSPVMALSSTEAMPSMTSPSPGMTSPASTTTTSPRRRVAAATAVYAAPYWGWASCFAGTSRRARRSVAAWALPRPSAIASAKLAKSTVNQSHSETARIKPAGASPWPSHAWRNSPVVTRLPTRTTHITGLRTWCRGSTLRHASTSARDTSTGSHSGRCVL